MNGATSARWEPNGAVRDHDVTKRTVESAESRARLQARTNAPRPPRGNNRQYAQALHRQADELCQCGEYESALVLYHRAAIVCPHDSSHSVAARRTAATISSWNNPGRSSAARLPASTRSDAISRVISCPESAAFGARDTSESSDLSVIPELLRYLDTRKKTSHEVLPALRSLTRSQTILKHINNRADAMLKTLEASFNAGKLPTSLRLAEDLLALSPDLGDPRRHRIPAYHYLSLIHAALGRHDRASSNVAALVRLSMSTKDVVLLSRALVTLGKVHLSFGYLEAAARAWENLSIHIDHPLPRAWLHHEIGRCHLETGKYVKALRKAAQCRECADEANSKKWTFHAGLLRAQCLAMLGRFAEALEELRVSAKISEEEGDTPTLSYIRDLIEQLNRALREVTFGEGRCSKDTTRRLSSPREELGRSGGNEAITTSGIKRTTCSREDALGPSLYADYLEDKTLDRCELDEESSPLDSAVSLRSKKTDRTYVIESRTDLSNRSELDSTKMHNEELTELLSCDSRMTFRTCYAESKHFIREENASAILEQRPIEARFSNIETSDDDDEGMKCNTFRISRSCENGPCDFGAIVDGTRYCRDAIARSPHEFSLPPKTKTWKRDDEEESFVRDGLSS